MIMNLDEAIEAAELSGLSHLDPALIEIVMKNIVLDADGKAKVCPRNILIDPQLESLAPQCDSNDDVLSFLKALDTDFISDRMKTNAIFITLFGVYLDFYPILKWQQESVPGLVITSLEPEAQKTRSNMYRVFIKYCFFSANGSGCTLKLR